jgi:serine/threonine protein kinase
MDPERLLGRQLGPYHIQAILGRGGMAVVYLARRDEADPVALKVLFPPPAAAAEVRTRFE